MLRVIWIRALAIAALASAAACTDGPVGPSPLPDTVSPRHRDAFRNELVFVPQPGRECGQRNRLGPPRAPGHC